MKKMKTGMKKLFALVLAAAALFCLASCGETSGGDEGPAVDLTAMNEQMRYAYLYDIINDPDRYIGKRIRLSGEYQNGYDDDMQDYYHLCLVYDPTACCALSVEFIKGGNVPDYPEPGTGIVIEGVLDSYSVAGRIYRYIAADVLYPD